MVDLVDSINVLIDESIDIPDIDKEDEFILTIEDNGYLTEDYEYHLSDIGIVLEDSNLGGQNSDWQDNLSLAARQVTRKVGETLSDYKKRVEAIDSKDVEDAVKSVGDKARRARDAVGNYFDRDDDIVDKARGALRNMGSNAKAVGQAIKDDPEQFARNVGNKVARDAKELKDDVVGGATKLWNKAKDEYDERFPSESQKRADKRGEELEAAMDARRRQNAADTRAEFQEKAITDRKLAQTGGKWMASDAEGNLREMTPGEKLGQVGRNIKAAAETGYERVRQAGQSGYKAISDTINNNPNIAIGVGAAVIAAAGAYALLRYFNSIWRLNKVVNYYKTLASKTDSPSKQSFYNEKVQRYEARLEQAKAKARQQKSGYIQQTKEMETRLPTLKNSDPKAADKLEKKLQARRKVLAKIGAL